MEGKVTLEEMTNYLKKCKNNVAPGSSGFSFDFYKFFWRDLKYFVINAVDYDFEKNRLSVSQSLGIVRIVPKGQLETSMPAKFLIQTHKWCYSFENKTNTGYNNSWITKRFCRWPVYW